MKILVGILLAVFVVGVFTSRPSYSLKPMDWTARSAISAYPNLPVVTKKDLLVYYENSGQARMAITRRNNEGVYVHVANFTQSVSYQATTNGKWVALRGAGNALFSVDATNTVSEQSFIYSSGGFLLSDDTFVGWDPNGYTICTFSYNASDNKWISIAGTELSVADVTVAGDWSTYQVSDTHLTLIDYTQQGNYILKIHERLSNRSWSLTDSFAVDNTFFSPGSPIYNGVDTVAYAIPAESNGNGNFGFVLIYTKVNDQWSLQHTFSATSVGYRAPAYFGWSTVFLDADTLLVSAGKEGNTSPDAGKVLMLTRNTNGVWEAVLDFVGSATFGLGIGVNDHDLIIPSLVLNVLVGADTLANYLTFNVAPRCFYQPINVTCSNQQVTDCADISSAELYTVNNPQCGAVTANLLGLSLVNNQALEAQFSFTRDFGSTVYCNATITCPAPPVTNAPPVITTTPATTAPVTTAPPVAPTSNNVNNAGVLQLGLASFFVTVVALLAL
jgi:hypothetical protein